MKEAIQITKDMVKEFATTTTERCSMDNGITIKESLVEK
jgi:hypothetical protein